MKFWTGGVPHTSYSSSSYFFHGAEVWPSRSGFYEVPLLGKDEGVFLVWFDIKEHAWIGAPVGMTIQNLWWRGLHESLGRQRRVLL